ncbi:DUF1353 domain-containing protein [Campylobacter sp. RM9344]|uniref:DUF1353 domain-containing protein n=1 Tax=Campylobacter californiensis TaxID=1032243 RepID=A0AAW3ZVU5_9BACT|nr:MULTISPECIES: DUF1353 domain-containing protein [unclassified Campylobacter]MBE3029696.1 DUF1353 domain-containing protein [Campylobacter sp. RM9344]MBE3607181.1 DUF1353 domain-containing protein [Campylobacter sp. RM9337]MBE3609519.1 DUF1353 domain-containing protein [Campylobacter sp. RM12916]
MNEIKRPILKPFSKDRFELVESYEYGNIVVPAAYKTNGANVPRILWSIFPPNSPEYLSAIVVHDWLCDEAELIFELGSKEQAKRLFKTADETLREMMTALGVARWKAYVFYLACRTWHIIKYK